MEIDFERYTRSLLAVLAVYLVLFLFVFLPFLSMASGLNLLGDPFLWLMILLNLLPPPLFALYFSGRLEGGYARLAIMIAAFLASFLSVFFILPLQF